MVEFFLHFVELTLLLEGSLLLCLDVSRGWSRAVVRCDRRRFGFVRNNCWRLAGRRGLLRRRWRSLRRCRLSLGCRVVSNGSRRSLRICRRSSCCLYRSTLG